MTGGNLLVGHDDGDDDGNDGVDNDGDGDDSPQPPTDQGLVLEPCNIKMYQQKQRKQPINII